MSKPPNRSIPMLPAHPSATQVLDESGPPAAAAIWDVAGPGVPMEGVDPEDAEQVTTARTAGAASSYRSSLVLLSSAHLARRSSRTDWPGSGT